jgi:glucose-1-phosphate adenylyltransferase
VVNGASLKNVLLADGCTIGEATIEHAVIGLRSQIKDGAEITNTVLMGADYFDLPQRYQGDGIPLGIGPNCKIDGALIDKNARIGEGVVIKPFPAGTEMKHKYGKVRDGIFVIPKSTAIPAGTVIEPE